MEVSLTNAWIVYVEICKQNNSISHSKFRERLVVVRVGDCRQGQICGQGGGASANRMTLTIWQRAETAWEAACDYSTSRGKTQGLHSVLQEESARQEERNNFILRYVCSPRRSLCGNMCFVDTGGLMKERQLQHYLSMGLMSILL